MKTSRLPDQHLVVRRTIRGSPHKDRDHARINADKAHL